MTDASKSPEAASDGHRPVDLDRTPAAVGYLPPAGILKRLMNIVTDKDGRTTATMPVEVLSKLIEAAAAHVFDEAAYLDNNADVADGVRSGRIPHGLGHFAMHGHFEGRAALEYEVDGAWYLATYPDVKTAIGDGIVVDAADHFRAFGYAEGRVPSPRYQNTIGDWMRLVAKQQGR